MTDQRYVVGKAFDIGSLRASKPERRKREMSPRDLALTKAIREASAAAESQVIPFKFPETEKPGTIKAAAKRLVKSLDLPVNVGTHSSRPNTLLLSRGTLSRRGRRAATPR